MNNIGECLRIEKQNFWTRWKQSRQNILNWIWNIDDQSKSKICCEHNTMIDLILTKKPNEWRIPSLNSILLIGVFWTNNELWSIDRIRISFDCRSTALWLRSSNWCWTKARANLYFMHEWRWINCSLIKLNSNKVQTLYQIRLYLVENTSFN